MIFLVALPITCFVVGCVDDKAKEIARAEAQAQQFLEQRNDTAAVEPLRVVLRLRPNTPNILADLGRSVMHSVDRQALLDEAQRTLEKDPNNVEALIIAASALLGRDDERKRLGYLRNLVRLRPNETVLKVTLAQELVNRFLYDEARPLLEDLIRTAPDDPAAYFLRGRVNYIANPNATGLAQAEADFKKVLELNSNVARTHLYLGRVYLLQSKPKEAIEHLIDAARETPDNPEVHFELTKAFRAVGDTKMAQKAEAAFVRFREQETLTEAMVKRSKAFPDDFALQLKTATLLLNRGDVDKAIFPLNRALALRPIDPAALALSRQMDSMLAGGDSR